MNFNHKIIEVCVAQAKYLLEEFQEFYPFAFGIKKDLTVIPIMTFAGDEFPKPENIIIELEKLLIFSNNYNNFSAVAICSDVQYSNNSATTKSNALEIRADFLNGPTINFYELYALSDTSLFSLKGEVLENGNLLFFNK